MQPAADHWLTQVSPAARQELIAAPVATVRSGRQPLMIEGHQARDVLLIHDGLVAITKRAPDGEELFLTFRRQGDLVGEFAVLQDQPRAATVWVIKGRHPALRVRKYGAAWFREFLHRHPDADRLIRRAALAKLTQEQARQASYRVGSFPERVARVLLDHADDHGLEISGQQVVIVAPLTNERMRQLIHQGERTVRLAFSELACKGLVAPRRKPTDFIHILDHPGLREVAAV